MVLCGGQTKTLSASSDHQSATQRMARRRTQHSNDGKEWGVYTVVHKVLQDRQQLGLPELTIQNVTRRTM